MSKKNKRSVLLVVDGHNMIYRGYYATLYSGGMSNKEGNETGAIKGFMNIFMADFKKIGATHCVVVFDRPGLNFRHRLYPEYKATREKGDDAVSLTPQVNTLRHLLKALGVRVIGIKGEEGDDLIGSTAVSLASEFDQVIIDSRDKDFASLITDKIWQMLPKEMPKGIDGVVERFGVQPNQMIDYLMLVGDSVDNIPGVYKVAGKTAAKLLNEYGSLRNIVKNKDSFTPALKKNLTEAIPQFKLTKKLITIATDRLPDLTKEDTALVEVDQKSLKRICKDLDFQTTYQQMLKFRAVG